LRLREHYDDAEKPAWAYPEDELAYELWAPAEGGVGYVTPWHKPNADVATDDAH